MDNIPDNFLWSGVHSGLKGGKTPDLGLVYSSYPSTVAGVFTRNNLPAAPVIEARRRLAEKKQFHGLIVNSGVANAANGEAGLADNLELMKSAANYLNIDSAQMLSASTGYIGRSLPLGKLKDHLPKAVDDLQQSPDEFSRAILTTDTCAKVCRKNIKDIDATMLGIAKGSGMINPHMATMLAFIFLDYPVESSWWQDKLSTVCGDSFNEITIDGETSTNDTVLAWAAELPERQSIDSSHPAASSVNNALTEICENLAYEIVCDGEGATCTVEVRVQQAKSEEAARRIAEEIAGSPLVRTAFYGRDPNWGRIYSAIGAAGVPLKPEKLEIRMNDTVVYRAQQPVRGQSDLREKLETEDHHTVTVKLGQGRESVRRITCDLSEDYVRINSNYG